MLALLKDLHLKLATNKYSILPDWNNEDDLFPLIALVGIPKLDHFCDGQEEESSFSAVSDISLLFAASSQCLNRPGQGERFKKVVKGFRFEAKDPTVSHFN